MAGWRPASERGCRPGSLRHVIEALAGVWAVREPQYEIVDDMKLIRALWDLRAERVLMPVRERLVFRYRAEDVRAARILLSCLEDGAARGQKINLA